MSTSSFKFPMEKLNGPTWVGHPLPVQLAEIGEGEGDGEGGGAGRRSGRVMGEEGCGEEGDRGRG